MAGIRSFFVNAGGDVVVGAPPAGRSSWRVGIRDPLDATAVRATLDLRDIALATSGSYERGDHVRRTSAERLASVTVVGPELGIADALATAVYASGAVVPSWWDHEGEYAVVAIDAAGSLRWTANAARFGLEYGVAA